MDAPGFSICPRLARCGHTRSARGLEATSEESRESAAPRSKNYLLESFMDFEDSTLTAVSRRLYVGIAPSVSSI